MKEDIIISIFGLQFPEDGEDDQIELITSGKYYKEDGVYCISYEESELTGMNGTTTTFRVEDERVTLTRSGQISAQMIFEKGKKHVSFYETQMGFFTIGVNAHVVKAELDDSGGNVEVDYSVEVDHALAGENIFKINVRPAGQVPLS